MCLCDASMRTAKASLIYRRTRNLRPVQLLLGRTKSESTVCYIGIEVDDAVEIASVRSEAVARINSKKSFRLAGARAMITIVR